MSLFFFVYVYCWIFCFILFFFCYRRSWIFWMIYFLYLKFVKSKFERWFKLNLLYISFFVMVFYLWVLVSDIFEIMIYVNNVLNFCVCIVVVWWCLLRVVLIFLFWGKFWYLLMSFLWLFELFCLYFGLMSMFCLWVYVYYFNDICI